MTNNIITLNDVRHTKFFWIWCDIYGNGLSWEMASRLGDKIVFYESGSEETFEDATYPYLDYPVFLCEEPEPMGNPGGYSNDQ